MAHRPEEGPKGAGGSQVVMGGWAAAAAHAGGPEGPSPRPPAATVWLKVEKRTSSSSGALLRLLRFLRARRGRSRRSGSEPGRARAWALEGLRRPREAAGPRRPARGGCSGKSVPEGEPGVPSGVAAAMAAAPGAAPDGVEAPAPPVAAEQDALEAAAAAGAPAAEAAAGGGEEEAVAGGSLEVEGFGGSLLEAIAEGVIASPALMPFGDWVRWRAAEGRRVRSTPAIAASEAALWRATMAAVHGDGWEAGLRRPIRLREEDQVRRDAAAGQASPVVAGRPAGVLALLDTPSPQRGADGGSDATGAFSEGSWGPLSDDEVRERFERDLAPAESMLDFERRLLRARAVLTLRRLPVADGVMEHAMRKARFAVAARSHPEGVAAALEARLHAVLDVE